MAPHDFAPAWLNFPTTPLSRKSSLNFEKHSENFSGRENHYDVSHCRRHNSSDGFDSCIQHPNRGNFWRKEKNGWHTHGRNGTENINRQGGYHGGNSRYCNSIFYSGKRQGLHENSIPGNETWRKEDKRECRQFEAEDFPSLNPEYDIESNQNKSLAVGVWVRHAQIHTYPTKKISQAPLLEYPRNPKSRAPTMLVIKKGNTKGLQPSGFPVAENLQSHRVKNGTGPNFYKCLILKPAVQLTKPTEWKSSIFHSGKRQGLHENSIPNNETRRKEDKRQHRQFEAEDFPSLNPEYYIEPNQNKSLAVGVWVRHAQTHTYPTTKISQANLLEYSLNPESRAPRVLVIKKGNTKVLQLSGFPVAGNLQSQVVKNGTGPNVNKSLIPKLAVSPTKPTQWKSNIFYSGKSQGLHENSIPDNETRRKEDKREHRQYETEDFPAFNPEYDIEPNQNISLAVGVWVLHAQTHPSPTKKISQAPLLEYPPSLKSSAPRMLVIKKGNTKGLELSGFQGAGNLQSQTVKNGTGPNVYKCLIPKPAVPPIKPTQWKSQTKENKVGTSFPHESIYAFGKFHTFKSTAKSISPSTNSEEECNRSNSSSPDDKLKQPTCLTKLTRIHKDKKSEFFKTLKSDRVEEELDDKSHVGSEKEDHSPNLHNSNSAHQERDINRNFDENEIPQENSNASVISQKMIQSLTFPEIDVLSSSLEAEHRLLKEMGWQEDSENDETYAPLTEDEIREFQVIREQLEKNGLQKNGILKNGLICDFKFGPWKYSTFKTTNENEDPETSSSDTSDDDDW